ncbi:13-hydroxylupanine O-tigloyltransferase [Spatholobus suberectus]|nr:13-hydroxylupanine O-tigloyltransferase [Spatholobus suberectus]
MVLQTSSLHFTVRRYPAELVAPANPTPRELKLLSDIDDQHDLRYQLPFVQFYRYRPSMAGKDPVQIIRKALATTPSLEGLGRVLINGKLMVDCNDEGVLFIEADADVTIEQFGDNLMPPFPCFDELLYNVPGSDGIVDCPLMLLHVTHLKCGGFIFALPINQTMCDASGIARS